MTRIGTELLKQSKNEKSSTRKDILSVLAQANAMEEKSHQMSDEDVLSRAYELILDWCIYLDYCDAHQRSLLLSSPVMKQQGLSVRQDSEIENFKS
jgi:hypothetical protein